MSVAPAEQTPATSTYDEPTADKSAELRDQVRAHAESAGAAVLKGSEALAVKLRTGSRLAAQSLEELQRDLPRHKANAQRLVDELREHEALKLRPAESARPVSEHLHEYEELRREVLALPLPVAAAAAFLALRLGSGLAGLADLVLSELLNSHTFLARVGLVGATVPGYLLAETYRHQFAQECVHEPDATWPYASLVKNYRRLPPAFYICATVSAAVTCRAASEVAETAIRRAFRLRVRTLAALGALLWIFKFDGKITLSDNLGKLRDRLPPPAAQVATQVARILVSLMTSISSVGPPMMEKLVAQYDIFLKNRSSSQMSIEAKN